VAHVHRLRLTDRIFYVNVNLRPRIKPFRPCEYALIIEVLEASRRRLGFLLCGYVLMPDHWHALIWPQYPLLIPNSLIKEEGEVQVVGDGSGQRLGLERVGKLRRSLIRVEEIAPARWGSQLDSRHAQTRQALADRIPAAV